MKYISCPSCRKQIPVIEPKCPHCGFDVDSYYDKIEIEGNQQVWGLGNLEIEDTQPLQEQGTRNPESGRYQQSQEQGVRNQRNTNAQPSTTQNVNQNVKQARGKTKIKRKTKYKRKKGLRKRPLLGNGKNSNWRNRKNKRRGRERSFRGLFVILLLAALLIAGFWGYKQYGQRVLDYLKYIKANYRIEKVENPEEEPQGGSHGNGQEVEQNTESNLTNENTSNGDTQSGTSGGTDEETGDESSSGTVGIE